VALVGILIISSTILSALGLEDNTRAFGMPEGTIRAVIALGLIIIFAIMAIYLYTELRSPATSTMTGLSQNQLNQIPAENILSSVPNSSDPALYDVKVANRHEASEDFAKQILTLVGTLVVAVASFYFGTQAVNAARGGTEPSSVPVIRTLSVTVGFPGEEKQVEITGKNFKAPKTVKLVHVNSKSEIILQDIISNATLIKGNLAFAPSQETGFYDLVVVNSDDAEDKLPKAFEMKPKV
jgi:hypothetical protein